MNQESLRKIKFLTVLAPLCYVVMAEFFREFYVNERFTPWQAKLIIFVSTFIAAMVFSEFVFSLIYRMQLMLDRERRRIETLFHRTSDAVVIIDSHDRVVAMNPAGYKLFGLSADRVRSGEVRVSELFAKGNCDQSDQNAGSEWWTQARQKGQVPYFEASVCSSSQKVIPVTGSATLIPDEDGASQVALIMRDMSEKKVLEAELDKRRRQAEGLYEIGLDLASLVAFEEKLYDALRKVKSILGVHMVGWAFIDDLDGQIGWKVLEGCDGCSFGEEQPHDEMCPVLTRAVMEALEALVWQCIREKKPATTACPCLNVTSVPVELRGRVVGALLVGCGAEEPFSDADIIFLSSVATQAAVALENRELYNHGQSQAILEERERVAKEMHDGFGQTLTYLTAMVATMEQLLIKNKVDLALAKLAETKDMLREAHQEVRMAIFNLRQKPSSDDDFVGEVNRLVQQFSKQSNIEVEVVADPKGGAMLPFEKRIQVLRIIQEALTNTRKHSGASRAVVYLSQNNGYLDVTIADNGCGFDPVAVAEKSQHFGLKIMQERSQAVGGQLDIESSPGKGTTIHLRVPLRRWAHLEVG